MSNAEPSGGRVRNVDGHPAWRWARFLLFAPALALFPAARRRWRRNLAALGWPAAVALVDAEMLLKVRRALRRDKGVAPLLVSVPLSGGRPPLWFRYHTVDYFIVEQVLSSGDYNVLGAGSAPRAIVDCGANIGMTARFFLEKYPNSRVIAVEPDPENAEVCRRNLEGFGARGQVIVSAVWGQEVPLKVEKAPNQSAWQSMMEVRPALPGESPDLTSIRIERLLDRAGFELADVVKIDVEGAEKDIFEREPERFLDRTRTLIIELHGPECEKAFDTALAEYSCDRELVGENVVCRNLRRRAD